MAPLDLLLEELDLYELVLVLEVLFVVGVYVCLLKVFELFVVYTFFLVALLLLVEGEALLVLYFLSVLYTFLLVFVVRLFATVLFLPLTEVYLLEVLFV